jgi:hypothetical protein
MKLSISEPCHESWNAMTPSSKGRHCLSCNKTVIDFADMSDEALRSYFTDHAAGNTCGRLRLGQLYEAGIPKCGRIVWSLYQAARKKVNGKYSRMAVFFIMTPLLAITGCCRRVMGGISAGHSNGSIRYLYDDGPGVVSTTAKAPADSLKTGK